MKKITVNHTTNTIEMSKATAKAASVYGSQAYNDLNTAKKDFPEYSIKTVETSKRSSVFKGMDFEFMATYINNHDDDEKSLTKNFESLRNQKLTYGEIKDWFTSQYPKFNAFTKRYEWILAD